MAAPPPPAPQQGLLYVTMRPSPELPAAEFDEWYNNEHGPARLRLAHIFTSGLRYRARDAAGAFMAVYDVADMALLETPVYTGLRATRSPREARTIARVDVCRRFFDLVDARAAPGFEPPQTLPRADGGPAEGADADADADADAVAVAVEVALRPGADADAYAAWFAGEHVAALAADPRWRRSRLFRPSRLDDAAAAADPVFFALHDYAPGAGDVPGTGPPSAAVASERRAAWWLLYVFGPAPRDLASLASLPASAGFTSPDGGATAATAAGPGAAIDSYVVVPSDGLRIRYRLEGSGAPGAPTVALANSLLTSLHMWDALVALLRRERPDVRILRYDARGRGPVPQPSVPATLATLADDLGHVLDALRIARLHALVGVSMGGATALEFALARPRRVARLVACDFNVASSPANTQAWRERVALAAADMPALAAQTVARWLHPAGAAARPGLVAAMTAMVAANDVDGFRHSCTALFDYDVRPRMPGCRVPALLVAGEADAKGALVAAMDGFRRLLGAEGAELRVVANAGHLPMCEEPEAFWQAIKDFL